MVETLHNRDVVKNNKLETRCCKSDFDACRMRNRHCKNKTYHGASQRFSRSLRLLFLLFIAFNSITFFIEGVSCNSHPEDFYKLLELTPQCSKADIKKSYRRLSKKYHPDKNMGDEQAAEHFKKITRAYEVLSDDEKRQIYSQGG